MYNSEHDILEQIRSGKKHLFARLIEQYKDRAMTLAFRMLKNREDAEEATQDAFVRAYNALDKFERRAKFSTWLYRIVYNVCLTRLGKKNGNVSFVREEGDTEIAEDMYPAVIPALEYDRKEMIELVQSAIETLPQKYGTILSLFYFQELSYDEICEVTQLPLGTVKVHLFRGRALLLKQLTVEYEILQVEG